MALSEKSTFIRTEEVNREEPAVDTYVYMCVPDNDITADRVAL